MLDFLFSYLGAYAPLAKTLCTALGSLVVVGTAYVKFTPNQDDDAWFAKLESIPVLGNLIKAVMDMSWVERK